MNRRRLFSSSAAAIALAGAGRMASVDGRGTPVASPVAAGPAFRVQFIRHAESQINVLRTIDVPGKPLPPDSGVTYPLTFDGVEQAVVLGDRLRDEDILAIVSSTRLRAIQTADAIAFPHGMTLDLAPEIVEVAFTDPDASMSTVDYLAAVATMASWISGNPDARTPGGESLTEVLARFLPFVASTISTYSDQAGTLVFVSHSITLGVALPYLFENLSPEWALTHGLQNAGIVSGAFIDGRLMCTDWQGTAPE